MGLPITGQVRLVVLHANVALIVPQRYNLVSLAFYLGIAYPVNLRQHVLTTTTL